MDVEYILVSVGDTCLSVAYRKSKEDTWVSNNTYWDLRKDPGFCHVDYPVLWWPHTHLDPVSAVTQAGTGVPLFLYSPAVYDEGLVTTKNTFGIVFFFLHSSRKQACLLPSSAFCWSKRLHPLLHSCCWFISGGGNISYYLSDVLPYNK